MTRLVFPSSFYLAFKPRLEGNRKIVIRTWGLFFLSCSQMEIFTWLLIADWSSTVFVCLPFFFPLPPSIVGTFFDHFRDRSFGLPLLTAGKLQGKRSALLFSGVWKGEEGGCFKREAAVHIISSPISSFIHHLSFPRFSWRFATDWRATSWVFSIF